MQTQGTTAEQDETKEMSFQELIRDQSIKENSQGDRRRHTVVPGEPVTNQQLIHLEVLSPLVILCEFLFIEK